MNSDQKNNVITYTATSDIYLNENAFNSPIDSHIFEDGIGIITFDGDVTSIGYLAFYHCYRLTSITIPNSITSIGDFAFTGCSGLKSITIPNSVTSIERYAFSGCSGLKSITIPNSVTSIGDYALSGCLGLKSITIPNSVTSIGDWAFYNCPSLTSITISNSVTSIGNSVFRNCSSLTSITIPSSVTSIGDGAFAGCISLTSITIPNSVTSIGYLAFYHCSNLTSITIPYSVTSIGECSFNDVKRKVVPTKTDDGKIKGYKGMGFKNGVMFCRDFIYEVGKTYKTDNISCCERGFHFCTNILDVFNYYCGIYGNEFIICEVEGSEEFDFDSFSDDTKICTSNLKVIRELSQKEVIDTINKLVKQPN